MKKILLLPFLLLLTNYAFASAPSIEDPVKKRYRELVAESFDGDLCIATPEACLAIDPEFAAIAAVLSDDLDVQCKYAYLLFKQASRDMQKMTRGLHILSGALLKDKGTHRHRLNGTAYEQFENQLSLLEFTLTFEEGPANKLCSRKVRLIESIVGVDAFIRSRQDYATLKQVQMRGGRAYLKSLILEDLGMLFDCLAGLDSTPIYNAALNCIVTKLVEAPSVQER